MTWTSYFYVGLTAIILVIHVFKIIKLFANPRFLRGKMWDPPKGKYDILGYYLCAIVLMLIVILLRVGVIE